MTCRRLEEKDMHDLDRTQLEYGSEISEYGEVPEYSSEGYELGESGTVLEAITGEGEAGTLETGYEYGESSMGEVMEDELASELLEISNEAELDHFLGKLISKAAKGIGRFVSSPAGQALGGILKQVASKALPLAGGALGTLVAGPAGAALGSKLASMAGDAFGLELEGLSPEDHDFELARRYVRFANDAAQRVAAAPPGNPRAAARAAVVESAKRYAPGLLAPASGAASSYMRPAGRSYGAAPQFVRPRPTGAFAGGDYGAAGSGQCPTCAAGQVHRRRQGKWIRRGRHIILLGV
jgi:hypothetical protein